MKDESDLIFQLMKETYTSNSEGSEADTPVLHDEPDFFQDSLYSPYRIEGYKEVLRIHHSAGIIDIPLGLKIFSDEEFIYRWRDAQNFYSEHKIIDETFKDVISNHFFVDVDAFAIFEMNGYEYAVFYEATHRERILDKILNLEQVEEEFKFSA